MSMNVFSSYSLEILAKLKNVPANMNKSGARSPDAHMVKVIDSNRCNIS